MKLFVYQGAGSTGVAQLPQFQAYTGRNPDGAIDFVNYTSTWASAVSEAQWACSCWKGVVSNLALAVPLCVDSYKPVSGSNQLKDVANGLMDADFTAIGEALVANGFPSAYIRLGWEYNGGWYPWAAAPDPTDWAAAFAHVMKVLKAVPGSSFIVLMNPTTGCDASVGFPSANLPDGMAWDVYANTWNSGSATEEPGLWEGDYSDYWGLDSIGVNPSKEGFYAQLPVVIPEFGVGTRSDGHGAPSGLALDTSGGITGTQVANGGDDPYYMNKALAFFASINAGFVGYWDYNAGDYNSMISDGSRPQQSIEFIKVFGSKAMQEIFANYGNPFTTQTRPTLTCTNCHATAHQNGPSHWLLIIWAVDAHASATVEWSGVTKNSNLYDPASATPTTPIEALGAASSWTGVLTPNHPLVIAIAQ